MYVIGARGAHLYMRIYTRVGERLHCYSVIFVKTICVGED